MAKPQVFREVKYSSPLSDTKEEAERALAKIRDSYSADHGWKEERAYVEPIEGQWRAVREHSRIVNSSR